MISRFFCFIFLIDSYLIFAQNKSNRSIFPDMNVETFFNPKKITKLSNYKYLPENRIPKFYIYLDTLASEIEGKKMYKFKFGGDYSDKNYLYYDKDKVFYYTLNSNGEVKDKQLLFDFSYLKEQDTLIKIHSIGCLDNQFLLRREVIKEPSDTIMIFDVVGREYKTVEKTADMRTLTKSNRLKDDSPFFYELYVSKKRGIYKIKMEVEYYEVTYE